MFSQRGGSLGSSLSLLPSTESRGNHCSFSTPPRLASAWEYRHLVYALKRGSEQLGASRPENHGITVGHGRHGGHGWARGHGSRFGTLSSDHVSCPAGARLPLTLLGRS